MRGCRIACVRGVSLKLDLYRVRGSIMFEKSLEIRDSILSEIDGNWSESDLRQGKRGSDIAKLIGKGLGTSWTHSRPLTPP